MAEFDKINIFGKTSMADVFKQIHKNTNETDKRINDLIDIMVSHVKNNAGTAVMVMPTIQQLLDVNVKNNEHLIKMASVVQRAVAAESKSEGDGFEIFQGELQELLEEQKKITLELDSPNVQKKIENVKHEN